MDDAGISPATGDPLIFDGKVQRYRIQGEKPGKKSGAYRLFYDENPGGWFMSHSAKHGFAFIKFSMRRDGPQCDRPIDDETRKKYLQDMEERMRERERQDKLDRAKAIRDANHMWTSSTPLNIAAHPYGKRKKLGAAHGARQFGDDIILPMQDERGEIVSVQRIQPDGEKRLKKHAPKRGFFIAITGEDPYPPFALPSGLAEPRQGVEPVSENNPDEPKSGDSSEPDEPKRLWICEGWATGISIREATGDWVVAAIDAGNLLPVAKKIKKLCPAYEIVCGADNDQKYGNTGVSSAYDLLEECGIPFVEPIFPDGHDGTDWNDYASLHGLEETKRALLEGLARAESDPAFDFWHRENLFPNTSANGNPKSTEANVVSLMKYLHITARYNMTTKSFEIRTPGRSFSIDNEKNAFDGYMRSKCVEYGLPENSWKHNAFNICDMAAYNPVQEWILSKPWDGRTRLLELIDTLETPASYPDGLKETLVTKWLISAVAAACVPRDFHCRGVLVLQGAQSQGKTSWFKRLIPSEKLPLGWFGEAVAINPDNRDSIKIAVSKWIVELGELEATFKKADMNKLKGFLTLASDELRLPYAPGESRYPRRTVFAATVNDRHFLIDDTGNTRWWVIECLALNYRHEIDMQQLFAEVYEEYHRNGSPWWLTREEEERLEKQNENYKIPSAIDDLIRRRLEWDVAETFWTRRSVAEVLIECGIERPTTSDTSKAGKTIQNITGQMPVRSGKNGSRTYLLPPSTKHPNPEGD